MSRGCRSDLRCLFALDQRQVNCLQDDSPFMLSAIGLAEARRRHGGPLKRQHIIQRLAKQRLFMINGHHEMRHIRVKPSSPGVGEQVISSRRYPSALPDNRTEYSNLIARPMLLQVEPS